MSILLTLLCLAVAIVFTIELSRPGDEPPDDRGGKRRPQPPNINPLNGHHVRPPAKTRQTEKI